MQRLSCFLLGILSEQILNLNLKLESVGELPLEAGKASFHVQKEVPPICVN